MKAVLCPVCNGSGKLRPTGDQSDNELKTCHGCNGKGWVEVREEGDTSSPPGWIPGYYYWDYRLNLGGWR